MTEQEVKLRVFAYSTDDEKMYAYNFTEVQLQEAAFAFTRDIFFMATDSEFAEFEEVDQVDNLKADFIYFHPTVDGASWWECTCGKFLETDTKGEDRMLKRTVAHARKTGHTIHPRGN